MPDCLFCKITKREIPSEKIYEDEHTYAFLDIHPNNHGHTLVIPKDHYENIYAIPDEEWCRLSLAVKKIALALKNGLDADGINLSMNNEEHAGQEIPHAHIHVIPRFAGDGFFHGRRLSYKETEKKEIAEKIRRSL